MLKCGDYMNLTNLKSELLQTYKYKIELHSHTSPASTCAQVKPRELVEVYKKCGYDAVVIANHFLYNYAGRTKEECVAAIMDNYKEAEEYGRKVGLKVYLGAEIRFTENINDYLVFGVNKEMLEEIYDRLPQGVEKFRNEYKMPHSVFVQAHPLRDKMEQISPALLDGIELFNMHPGQNPKLPLAVKYQRENNIKIITAGSDFHAAGQGHEGLSALRCRQLPEDCFALAELIKSGDYLLEVGKDNILLP